MLRQTSGYGITNRKRLIRKPTATAEGKPCSSTKTPNTVRRALCLCTEEQESDRERAGKMDGQRRLGAQDPPGPCTGTPRERRIQASELREGFPAGGGCTRLRLPAKLPTPGGAARTRGTGQAPTPRSTSGDRCSTWRRRASCSGRPSACRTTGPLRRSSLSSWCNVVTPNPVRRCLCIAKT